MSAIEFTAQSGKTFSLQLYNATTLATIGTALTPTEAATGIYRVSTGANTGVVYAKATATNVLVAGFADLDDVAANGYSALRDTYDEAENSSGVSVTVLPATGTETSRVSGTALTLFTSELIAVAVGVTDSDGVAVDLTGMTLELIFESGSTEVTIVDADITKTTSSFSFTTTTALVSAEKLWKWALRKTTDGAVVVSGTMEVIYKPNN